MMVFSEKNIYLMAFGLPGLCQMTSPGRWFTVHLSFGHFEDPESEELLTSFKEQRWLVRCLVGLASQLMPFSSRIWHLIAVIAGVDVFFLFVRGRMG